MIHYHRVNLLYHIEQSWLHCPRIFRVSQSVHKRISSAYNQTYHRSLETLLLRTKLLFLCSTQEMSIGEYDPNPLQLIGKMSLKSSFENARSLVAVANNLV